MKFKDVIRKIKNVKIKNSYWIIGGVILLVAIFIVMGVTRPDPHAGHDHGTTQSTADPHAGHDHANNDANQPTANKDLTPEQSYTVKDNKDGTYTVSVIGRSGHQFYSESTLRGKLTFTEVNQDVLEIADRSSANPAAHWAIYCDIQNHRVSKTYKYVLGIKDHHVAYVEHRTGMFQIFVSDLFDESAYFKGYPLEGAVNVETGSPKVTYKMNGTTMEVTYSTESGDKNISIKLFEK